MAAPATSPPFLAQSITAQSHWLTLFADDDEDSEEGGNGSGGPATRGRGRPPKKGKHAADAASVKATREKARREKLNEWCVWVWACVASGCGQVVCGSC